jgi:hypothetical protein
VRTDDFLDVMHELVAFVRVAEAGSSTAAALDRQRPIDVLMLD